MKKDFLAMVAVGLVAGPTGAHAASISYGLGAIDFGSPSAFSFSFLTPIIPIAGPATYSFTGSFTLTDGGADGVSLSLGSLPEYWRLSVLSPLTLLDDVGGTASLIGAGPHNFTASGSFDCAVLGGCTGLLLDVVFTGSGGNDTIASTGTFSLDPASTTVPEPGTLGLCGIGITAAYARYRSRRPHKS